MISLRADQNKILELQKELMNAILDYQVVHGTESISGWNVSISFQIMKREKGMG